MNKNATSCSLNVPPRPFGLSWQDTTDRLAYKPQKFISPSSGSWKSKLRVLAWSRDSPLLGHRLLTDCGARGWGPLWSLRHSSHEVKPLWPKPHLLIPSSWGIKIPYMNFGGHRRSDWSTYQLRCCCCFTCWSAVLFIPAVSCVLTVPPLQLPFLGCSEKKVKVLSSGVCPTLCDPMVCNPPGSSVPEILQARILVWVAIPFSRGSSRPGDQT